ncbi:MAG TPA: hypothetical protein VFB63_14935 [Bryobacteraceae bacterium]|nr:hypothetical protein [Bryobacteraceae bacterium]
MKFRAALLFPLLALSGASQSVQPAPDASAIIRKAFSRQEDFFEQARNYTYIRHEETRRLDRAGKVTKAESNVHEVTILYGEPYRKLIKKDGRDLDAKEAAKEQRKMDDEIAKRGRDQEKRRRETEKELADQRKALAEIADAIDWRIEGQETLAGRPAWVISGTPKAGYKLKSQEAKVLTKMRGKVWIDREDSRMVKADAVVNDTISFGWFLFRIQPGFHFTFEMTRVNDQVWLPRHGWLKGTAKVAGLKTYRMEMDMRYSDYRRFQSDSRVVQSGPPE